MASRSAERGIGTADYRRGVSDWQLLGPVVKTQIHVDRMVTDGHYEDHKILEVDELWLGVDGVIGQLGGQSLLHAHHRLHPNKSWSERRRDFRANRLLSVGFTGHYSQMAEQFGAAPLGCAAEDIIVEHDGVVTVEQLSNGVQVRREGQVVELTGVAVAKPCVPFTKWLLGNQDAADDVVAPNRAFLDNGMRGFIVGLANQHDPVAIRVGDELWAASSS